MTDAARDAVMDRLKVMAAYHAVQRQIEYGNGHQLNARKHHAAYLRLKAWRRVEEGDPDPKPPCVCDLCLYAYAEGRR